ncbi:site-specific integrase [Nocardioides sp. GY 10127]|uniref:tyrosine-type recombinase/integrase n=1 Tax=Nocardioides sp. GY 10127 TaxID=2569762 RepID=UPI0014580AD5|nr:site-specific integrase [Nocardioides sp. GY 10127]
MRSNDWTDPSRGRVTLDDFAPLWFDSLNVKPKTLAGYRSLYDTHIGPRFGKVRLDRLAYPDIKGWVSRLTVAPAKGAASATQRRAMSAGRKKQAYQVLCSILDLAVEDGRLSRNPAKSAAGSTKGMVPRAPKNRTHVYLTHAQVHALAGHMGDSRVLFLVLAYGGLRWSEASALRLRDVDLLRARLHVRQTFSEIGGKLTVSTPKNHATRSVPIPAFVVSELEAQMTGKGPDDLIFSAPNGGPWSNSNFRARRYAPALKAVGLEGLRIHDLRHTAASLAVQSGANVKAVQRMLGHSTAAMTLDVYADLFDDDLDQVAERLNVAALQALAVGGVAVSRFPGS